MINHTKARNRHTKPLLVHVMLATMGARAHLISCFVAKMSVANCCLVLHQLVFKRCAGHSKWANIKHIKATKDAQRSVLFAKLSRQIRVAIQEGGSANPDANLRLSQVIEQAKRCSMPVASIQNAIRNSITRSKGEDCKSALLEIRGPAGCFILCQVITDNLTRCKQTLSTLLRKHGVAFSDGGGRHLFERKGVVNVSINGTTWTEDKLMEHAIESGAEDVHVNSENTACFICGETELQMVRAVLEKLGHRIQSAEVQYIPITCVQLDEIHLDTLSSLFDKLEAQEEVVKLYDNIG